MHILAINQHNCDNLKEIISHYSRWDLDVIQLDQLENDLSRKYLTFPWTVQKSLF